jgi:fructokinase
MKKTFVVFDIGGTKSRIGISHDCSTLAEVASFHTPNNPKEGVKKMIETINELVGTESISVISGGIRGVLSEEHLGIVHDDILESWIDFDVVEALTKAFNVPVYLDNDAALAGLGEAHFGAGVGVDLLVYHTVSTGVGGVRITNGQIDAASSGFEPGHQVLDIDRTILGDGIEPTLENLVSGTAVERRLGIKPYDIPQEDVIWEELAGYLAQGLRNTILYWSPEAIILGGSMIIGDPKIPIEFIRKATVDVLDSFVECPYITTASLGDEAGLYGALALIRQHA